jgi:urease accessory protein
VSATATTQTAERAYASAGESAEVEVKARVGARGRLDWLPQETILYERSRLNRRTEIDLAADAALLMVETVVLGRLAMGEAPVQARLSDRRTVRRAGRPVWHETLRLDPGVLADAALPAVLGGARAMAVVALVAPGATDALGPVRAALGEAGVAAAASAWDGRCLVRMLAPDGWPLRRQLRRVLTVLRTGRPLPRVWQM